MDTRSAASLTNGSGEFFLVQVALGGPGHGEVLVEMHTDSSALPTTTPCGGPYSGHGPCRRRHCPRCGKQITHIQSGERVETIGFTHGIYA
jgi:hypothetical protein